MWTHLLHVAQRAQSKGGGEEEDEEEEDLSFWAEVRLINEENENEEEGREMDVTPGMAAEFFLSRLKKKDKQCTSIHQGGNRISSTSSSSSSSLVHLNHERKEEREEQQRERRVEIEEVQKKMKMFREKKKKKKGRSESLYEGEEELEGTILRDFLRALESPPGSSLETSERISNEDWRERTTRTEEEEERHFKEDTYDLLTCYDQTRDGQCMYSARGSREENRIRNVKEGNEEDLVTSFFFSPSAVSPTVAASVTLLDLLSRSGDSFSSSSSSPPTDFCTSSFILQQRKERKTMGEMKKEEREEHLLLRRRKDRTVRSCGRAAGDVSPRSPPREEEEESGGKRWRGEMLSVYMQRVLLPSLREKRREMEMEFICEVFDKTRVLEAIIVIRAIALLQVTKKISSLSWSSSDGADG